MSLKKNIIANYISQIYVTIIGILMVPLYIKYMGADAYGLVGFFAMLQAWFNLLDIGFTPMMGRETARYHGGATDALHYRRLVRALEGIFLVVATLAGTALFTLATYFANYWLRSNNLRIIEIEYSVQIMVIIIIIRWMGGLYRGVISGSERQVWLSTFNSSIATLRFVCVFPVLVYVDASPSAFFLFQLMVAVIELVVLVTKTYCILPSVPARQAIGWTWTPLKPVLKFSLTIAFTSSVWIIITQTDKLVLSKILTLEDYGYFTLAVLVASGIMIISGPVSTGIMPRMAYLEAQGKHDELIQIYRHGTQFVAVIAGALATTIAFRAEPLLLAWTGNESLAKESAPILTLYAFGNGILTVAAFPYYLQYAKGNLRLHLIGNALFVVLLVPTVIWAANNYGGIGAGYVWVGMNVLSFVAWLPLVHQKFAPGLNAKWYGADVLAIFLPMVIVGLLFNRSLNDADNNWVQIANSSVMMVGLLITGALSSSLMRKTGLILLKRVRKKRNI